jgi:hypothetical protein
MEKNFRNLLIIAFFTIFNSAFGQNNMEDVVYLKNGSIIRGVIVEQVPNQSIKVQTKDRNVFVFKYDEIEKMTRENLPTESYVNELNDAEFKKSGFINITEINFCPGVGNVEFNNYQYKNSDNSFGLKTVNGYQINEHFSIGIGIGIDKYKEATLLPITFDARATILKGKISPVFNANVGYSVGLNDIKGGLIINPSIGIKTYISKNTAYLFNVGYKLQSQEYFIYDYYSGFYVSKTVNFGFLTINTGFSF